MTRADSAYDPSGNMLWSDDGQGRTAYAYDADGRLSATIYPDGRCLGLRYDGAGNVAERISAGRWREQYRYDGANRLTETRFADGSYVTYRYDAAGRLGEIAAADCTTRYTYDDAGRPVAGEQIIAGRAYHTLFAYDADGHLTGVRVPGLDAWVRYAYDDQRRLASLGYDGAPELVRLRYEADSARVMITTAAGAEQSIELSKRSLVRRITLHDGNGAAVFDLRYRSVPPGQVVALGDERYRYDDHGRLSEYGPLSGPTVHYSYDAAGNRLEAHVPGAPAHVYHYDAGGRLTRICCAGATIARYAYDGEGALTGREDHCGAWSYRYDAGGRLTRAERAGRFVAAYTYDHTGRRIASRSPSGTTIIHRDPWGNRIAETSAGETRVFLGPAGQHLACLVVCDGCVTVRFLHADHLGSVRAVTDERGQVVARYDFDPWGMLRSTAGEERWRIYAGHPYDAALGWYECGVRLYDPQIGRFTTADSYTFAADDPRLLWVDAAAGSRRQLRAQRLQIWQREGACRNRYVYARNSPLTYVDRDGHNAGLYFLYTLAAIFWALPYTLVGFLFFEVFLNWITFAWLWDWGRHRWAGESSDRLGAWAWWVIGGLSGRLVIGGGAFTLGNFIIANADFMDGLDTTRRSFGIPVRHNELVDPLDTSRLLTQREAIVEHELRHTNQYGWWGPFMMPWVLLLYFLFQNLLLTAISAISRRDVHVSWQTLWQTISGSWWQATIAGASVLLLPGAYWWDYIGRGGYGSSWFEQDAAQHSGAANAQNVRANAAQSSLPPGGSTIISVISDPNRTGALTLTVTTSASGGAAPVDITPAAIGNLRIFRYTAGPNAGTDVLTAGDGSSTFQLEITVA